MRLMWRFLLLCSLAGLSLGETVEVTPNGETASPHVHDCSSECAQLVEQRLAPVEQQLQEAIKRAETAETLRDDAENKLVEDLRAKLLEATELQVTAEASASECAAALDVASQREKQFKEEVDAHFTTFRSEIEELTSHKHQKVEMEQLVASLNKDLDGHKNELSATRDSFKQELEDHRSKLRETADSHSESRKELFHANEKIRELHDLVATTYVNVTLIQQDLVIGANKAAAFSEACWVATTKAVAPYWGPFWNSVVASYREHIVPVVAKTAKTIGEAYELHLKETLEPVVDPVLEHLSKLHVMSSTGLKQACRSLMHYLELLEDDTAIHRKVAAGLEYTENHSVEVLNNILTTVLVLFLMWFFWPRRTNRKSGGTPEASVKITTNRKGLRVKNKHGGKSTPTQ